LVTIIQWTNELIIATIPEDIVGEVRGPCAFQATTIGGQKTPWFSGKQAPLTFTPTTDFAVLDQAHVTVSHCSDDAGDNKCNGTTSEYRSGCATARGAEGGAGRRQRQSPCRSAGVPGSQTVGTFRQSRMRVTNRRGDRAVA
jgi:hypothetical protein